jgi:hypothetical protein
MPAFDAPNHCPVSVWRAVVGHILELAVRGLAQLLPESFLTLTMRLLALLLHEVGVNVFMSTTIAILGTLMVALAHANATFAHPLRYGRAIYAVLLA